MTESDTTVAHLSDLREVVDEYRSCELATMSRSGMPITWPIVCEVSPAADRIVVTTSISFPQKAFNIRRDPRVAMLFSDPTGTGRIDLPQVLVRGRAVCPPEIRTGTDGLEGYWRRLALRQPASRGNGGNPVGRWLLDWYYMRLVITVTPHEPITIRPPDDPTPMLAAATVRADRSAFGQLCRELPAFSSGVLGTAAGDDLPVLRRVRLLADPATSTFVVSGLAGDDAVAVAGPASLLLHRHDDQLSNQRQIGALGSLVRIRDSWHFRPDRLLPNQFPTNPIGMARVVIRARRAADRYLDRRGLQRPTIDWAAHRACEQR